VSSLAWYAGRAAAMSPSEMMWRAGRVSYKLARSLGPRERPGSGLPATSEPGWDTLLYRFREGAARLVLLDQERRSPNCSRSSGRAGKHRLTMDIGPLGYLPIAAGRELVFDLGTASYYSKPPSRGMDRGARAHAMEAPTRPEWVGPHAPQEDEP